MPFTEEQRDFVKGLYESTRNRRTYAAELFKKKYRETISVKTINKIWEAAGFPKNSHGGARRGFTEGQFREIYTELQGDIRAIIAETGYTMSGINKLCKRFGLEYKITPKPRKLRLDII